MTNLFIDHILEATWGQTLLNIFLLILCLYPVVGSFFGSRGPSRTAF